MDCYFILKDCILTVVENFEGESFFILNGALFLFPRFLSFLRFFHLCLIDGSLSSSSQKFDRFVMLKFPFQLKSVDLKWAINSLMLFD